MAGSDGTSTATRGRPFDLDGEDVELVKNIQGRTGLVQRLVIKAALQLLDKQTAGMRKKTDEELMAEIVGTA
jgi:hypothetical protein